MSMAAEIEPFYVDLGRTIRLIRRKGPFGRLTQDELSQRLEQRMTRAAIANIESGKQRVLAHTLCDLAQALGVSPMELLPKSVNPDERRSEQEAVQVELLHKIPSLSHEKASGISRRIAASGISPMTTATRGAKPKLARRE